MKALLLVAVLAADVVLPGCQSDGAFPAPSRGWIVQVGPLTEPNIAFLSIVSCRGGEHYAYARRTPSGMAQVVADGKPDREYRKVDQRIVFSPDGKRSAYRVWPEAEAGETAVIAFVVDGNEGSRLPGWEHPWYGPAQRNRVTFSSDSKRFFYAGSVGGGGFDDLLVLDGNVLGPYGGVLSPCFSADGRHFGYMAYNDGSWWFPVVDGKVIGHPDEWVYDDTLIAVGTRGHYAVEVVVRGDEPNTSAEAMLLDGRLLSVRWRMFLAYPTFSPDGNRLAVRSPNGVPPFMFVDGRADPVYDTIGDPVFSPDSRRLAYAASKDGRSFIVVDGVAGPGHEEVCWPAESASYTSVTWDSSGYSAQFVYSRFPRGPDIVFSPDSKHLAYAVRDAERWAVVRDGNAGKEYARINSGSIVFSPNGRHLAYSAGRIGVVDGQEYELSSIECYPIFSLDSRHVAYVTPSCVFIDGRPGPLFDQIVPDGPAFLPGGSLQYIAMRGGTLYRVRHMPK